MRTVTYLLADLVEGEVELGEGVRRVGLEGLAELREAFLRVDTRTRDLRDRCVPGKKKFGVRRHCHLHLHGRGTCTGESTQAPGH